MALLLSFQNVPPAPGRETGTSTTPITGAPADHGAPAGAAHASDSPFGSLPQILIMVVPLVLLMLFTSRSNSKKQKKLMEGLQKGDRVILQGGLVGKLVELGDRLAKVELAPGMKVEVLKSGLLGKDDAETAASLEKK